MSPLETSPNTQSLELPHSETCPGKEEKIEILTNYTHITMLRMYITCAHSVCILIAYNFTNEIY